MLLFFVVLNTSRNTRKCTHDLLFWLFWHYRLARRRLVSHSSKLQSCAAKSVFTVVATLSSSALGTAHARQLIRSGLPSKVQATCLPNLTNETRQAHEVSVHNCIMQTKFTTDQRTGEYSASTCPNSRRHVQRTLIKTLLF